MKVLMISTDAKLLEKGSEVCARMNWYASVLDRLDILLITSRKTDRSIQIGSHVAVYPRRYWQGFGFAVPTGTEIISAQDPFENGLIGWWLARQAKLPLQVQIHTDLFSPYFWRESLKNKIRLLFARWLLPQAKSIRVVSSRIKDSLANHVKNTQPNITVLPVWIDMVNYQNTPIKTDLKKLYPQFTKIVLVASRLTKEKNITMLIEALPAIIAEVPGAGLIIVGIGPEHIRLEDRVRKLKLESHVVFFGWSDDLASCFKTADVFVNTSWYEGFGRTIVEALACGCPVVSTDVGIAREVGATIADFGSLDLSIKMVNELSRQRNVVLPANFIPTREAYLSRFIHSLEK